MNYAIKALNVLVLRLGVAVCDASLNVDSVEQLLRAQLDEHLHVELDAFIVAPLPPMEHRARLKGALLLANGEALVHREVVTGDKVHDFGSELLLAEQFNEDEQDGNELGMAEVLLDGHH